MRPPRSRLETRVCGSNRATDSRTGFCDRGHTAALNGRSDRFRMSQKRREPDGPRPPPVDRRLLPCRDGSAHMAPNPYTTPALSSAPTHMGRPLDCRSGPPPLRVESRRRSVELAAGRVRSSGWKRDACARHHPGPAPRRPTARRSPARGRPRPGSAEPFDGWGRRRATDRGPPEGEGAVAPSPSGAALPPPRHAAT